MTQVPLKPMLRKPSHKVTAVGGLLGRAERVRKKLRGGQARGREATVTRIN